MLIRTNIPPPPNIRYIARCNYVSDCNDDPLVSQLMNNIKPQLYAQVAPPLLNILFTSTILLDVIYAALTSY